MVAGLLASDRACGRWRSSCAWAARRKNDGFGDFYTTALAFAAGSKIKIDERIYFPQSLGIFYTAIAQFLGFPNFGDEEKLMSLAATGEPSFLEQLREILVIQPDGTFCLSLKYFRHHTEVISYRSQNCGAKTGRADRATTQGHRMFRPGYL